MALQDVRNRLSHTPTFQFPTFNFGGGQKQKGCFRWERNIFTALFTVKKFSIFFFSKKYGKLSLGQHILSKKQKQIKHLWGKNFVYGNHHYTNMENMKSYIYRTKLINPPLSAMSLKAVHIYNCTVSSEVVLVNQSFFAVNIYQTLNKNQISVSRLIRLIWPNLVKISFHYHKVGAIVGFSNTCLRRDKWSNRFDLDDPI